MNQRLAELVGAIIGDGCISYKPKFGQYFLEMVGNPKEEQEYMNYLAEILIVEYNFNPSITFRERAIRMKVYSKNFIEFLIFELKLVCNKEKCANITIPLIIINNPLWLKRCLRGIVDTDGSLFLANKGYRKDYPTIEISTISRLLAIQLQEVLSKDFRIGFRSFKQKGFQRIYRISLNGDVMVDKWFNDIGFSNQRNIRKYKKLKDGASGI